MTSEMLTNSNFAFFFSYQKIKIRWKPVFNIFYKNNLFYTMCFLCLYLDKAVGNH